MAGSFDICGDVDTLLADNLLLLPGFFNWPLIVLGWAICDTSAHDTFSNEFGSNGKICHAIDPCNYRFYSQNVEGKSPTYEKNAFSRLLFIS